MCINECFLICVSLYRAGSISSQGTASGQRRRLYSAVPGRVFVATRSHSAQGDREISLNKGDKVKGECVCMCMCRASYVLCVWISVGFRPRWGSAIKCVFVSVCFSQVWINVVCVCILVICVGMSVYVCLRAVCECMCVCNWQNTS